MVNEVAIIRYLNNEASPLEKQELLEWLKENVDNKRFFYETRSIWVASQTAFISEPEVDLAYEKFFSKIKEQTKPNRKVYVVRKYQMVASIALFIISAAACFFLGERSTLNTVDGESIVMNQALMGEGSRGSIELPDGTKVWLNEKTTLSYPSKFSSTDRKVFLTGEAYFEVVKNREKPFLVETKDMEVRVLGTKFVVQSYENKKVTETILLSGKVSVIPKGEETSYILEPNQKLSINKEKEETIISSIISSETILWTNDKMTFANEPLSDILRKMGYWYGIEIKCSNDVPLDLCLSLTVRKESKEEIFDLMKLIAPIQIREKGDIIYVTHN